MENGGLEGLSGGRGTGGLLLPSAKEAVAYPQNPVFEAAVLFARTEGLVAAPETAHAIRAAIDEALKCRDRKEEKVIVFNFSGHGHFDLSAYDAFLSGKLEDYEYPREKIRESLQGLPRVPGLD